MKSIQNIRQAVRGLTLRLEKISSFDQVHSELDLHVVSQKPIFSKHAIEHLIKRWENVVAVVGNT